MCLNENTPDAVVLGGSGRFPLTTNLSIRCLKYWLKFLKDKDQSENVIITCWILKPNCLWTGALKSSAFCVKITVNMLGLPNVENDNSFIKKLTKYIRRRHLEAWQTSLHSSSKLSFYRTIKTAYSHEHYLNILNLRK